MSENTKPPATAILGKRPATAIPVLTVIDGGATETVSGASANWHPRHGRVREQCVICGAEVATRYVWVDWGPGGEAICSRSCADALLDALDACLANQHPRER